MHSLPQPFADFPTRRDHEDRWAELGRAIAATRERVTDDPAALSAPATPGELTVLGSGIEAAGFSRADEHLIAEADHVFYCVADPATAVWLKALRPDAYDLYVLYEDTKPRYLTYMQMTEALLHFVRAGHRVAAVFYGHPGVFVLSTHRAVRIARREGHRAVMRPAVSALDALCADLGVDPSQPGMQMFEATDMLIRRRRVDPGLHLVLWQVGLIGDLGYRRDGYLNGHLPVLLDYLEEIYGPRHEVVNYTAARYPGTDPVVARHALAELRSPGVQRSVTGISTWYLAPAAATPADTGTLTRLGLLRPGQSTREPDVLRQIDRYGPRELRAFDDFADYAVPAAYQWQEDTDSARFLLALRDDPELRRHYREDPTGALGRPEWQRMPGPERGLLAKRDPGATQIAAKGLRTAPDAENTRMLRALLTRRTVARSLLRAVRRPVPPGRDRALRQWADRHGYTANWSGLRRDMDVLLAAELHPWSGLYLAPKHQIAVYVLGRATTPASHRVYLNGVHLVDATYQGGVLSWTDDNNDWNGKLRTDVSRRWTRRLIGTLWPADEAPTREHHLGLAEHRLPVGLTLADLTGTYRTVNRSSRRTSVTVRPEVDGSGLTRMRVEIDGTATGEPVTVGARSFRVGTLTVPFAARLPDRTVPPHLLGTYRVRVGVGRTPHALDLALGAHTLTLGGTAPKVTTRRREHLTWSGGPDLVEQGEVTLVLDPLTLHAQLFGTGRTRGGEAVSLVGMVPVTPTETELLTRDPRYGIPEWAWPHLATLAAESSRKGGLFLWHGWERAATNARNLRWALYEAGL